MILLEAAAGFGVRLGDHAVHEVERVAIKSEVKMQPHRSQSIKVGGVRHRGFSKRQSKGGDDATKMTVIL